MLYFDSAYLTSASVTARTSLTQRFIFKHPATVSGGLIWSAKATSSSGEDPQIYYGTNTIIIANASASHEDNDIWSFPVTANAWDDIAIAWDVNGSTTPVVYKNGVAQTVSVIQTTTGLGTMKTDTWTLGNGVDSLGYIGGYAWWNDRLSNANLEKLTSSRIHNMPLWISPSTLVDFIPMDPVVGNTWDALPILLPDGDITNTWNAGTYSDMTAIDSSKLVCNKADDNELYTCSMGTTTLSGTVSFLKLTLRGLTQDTAVATVYMTKGDGTNLTSTTTSTYGVAYSNLVQTVTTTATQSDIDGLKLNIQAPTMGKDDELWFDYAQIEVGYSDSGLHGVKGTVWVPTTTGGIISVGLSGSGWGY